MIGNKNLAKLGLQEEALGHNAILAGFRASGNGPTTGPAATSWRRC